jgi:hypothetical protein
VAAQDVPLAPIEVVVRGRVQLSLAL